MDRNPGIALFCQRTQLPARRRLHLPGCSAVLGMTLAIIVFSPLSAQTVQLPTFGVFTYSGAVMVPDGGSIRAGGIGRYAEGSVSNGVPGLGNIPGLGRGFRNQAMGRESGSSGLSIRPTILIMSELEEDHLARAGYGPDGQRAGSADAVLARAIFLSKHVGRNESRETVMPASSGRR
jgi:hypothetical protein